MRDALGTGTVLGYCTNVHPVRTLDELKDQLGSHAAGVRERVCPGGELGLGLWLPASVASGLAGSAGEVDALRLWLERRGLFCFGFNGFPYGDFHAEAVKTDVYRPDWTSEARAGYTRDLGAILARLAPEDIEPLTVTTLPLGWRDIVPLPPGTAERLVSVSAELEEMGVALCVEPEPGCVLERSADAAALCCERAGERAGGGVAVCHDVCHAAVMGEDQRECLGAYAELGIAVPRVQVSSCPVVRGGPEPLAEFDEPRYLHQTVVDGVFFEDLPGALSADGPAGTGARGDASESRTHFHVPVYLDRIGPRIGTTRDRIAEAVAAARDLHGTRVFEVETYAWGVLPEALRPGTLSEGIASELQWCLEHLAAPSRAFGETPGP